jgi:hypothetical protein
MNIASYVRSFASARLIAGFFALTGATHAANVLTNGDFETGSFVPWTASGDAHIETIGGGTTDYGLHSCFVDSGSFAGKLEQTVPTNVGALYYLALDVLAFDPNSDTNVTISGTPAAGAPADGSRTFQARSGEHYTLLFHATTASTKIAIEFAGSCIIDNIQLIRLPASPRAGKYTGTAKTVLKSASHDVTNKSTAPLVARITTTGQIVILEGTGEFAAGILLPDGTLDIRLRGRRQVFNTTIEGGRISFVVNGFPPNLLDEGLNELAATVRTTYTLTRVTP